MNCFVDGYFVSVETVKFYNWIVKCVFSDFNCYWRIALFGCLKTAVYGRGSIQRVGTWNISLLFPLAINTGFHAQFFIVYILHVYLCVSGDAILKNKNQWASEAQVKQK